MKKLDKKVLIRKSLKCNGFISGFYFNNKINMISQGEIEGFPRENRKNIGGAEPKVLLFNANI